MINARNLSRRLRWAKWAALGLVLVLGSSLSNLVTRARAAPPLAYATWNWPQFRGPAGDGHADGQNPPLKWSASENIVWKTPIHDAGWSSPVVWGKQIWLTAAQSTGHELFALCIDLDSGKVLHDIKVFDVESPEPINAANTYASPTPLIEAGRVYVHFGTYGTACLDTATGKVLWARRDIHCTHQMGPGSSLASVGNALIFHMDGIDEQYVIALDRATGLTLWKTPRSIDYSAIKADYRKAYSTPAIAAVAGHTQLVCTAGMGAMGYDAQSGQELWKVRYVGWSAAVRPVCSGNLAFLGIDCSSPQLWAVRLDGHGDVTDTHVAWKIKRHMPATASPLLADDLLYVVSDQGFLSCIEPETGKVVWEQKLEGTYAASPLYAGRRIYVTSRQGITTVLSPGRTVQILAVNPLEATVLASPAVVEDALIVRSKTDLYRIGSASR